ncbi:prostaglandin E receptor 2b subtype EP2 [Pimephales promelas]|uniref:prostaglandin E receptor 2b subtype EP2 n=1 Tax=Pimephales promelas TaxID=90988 RepID=UPI0019555082|nr:prostaglandin E receptor 2b subtype EP2 [Pimephales promelas]KAG1964751.1 prostacyclin receptor [Pimephales promelas]
MASFAKNVSCQERLDVSEGSPTTSAIMFSAGVLGNVVALVLLEIRRRKKPASLFQVLVTSLVITDLLGTFSVSPLVLTAYLRKQSLLGMNEKKFVCGHFGYAMTFFSLVTLAILLSMAVERWLSLGHPYFYEKRLSKRCGYITIALIYLLCALFCITPFFGFGKYIQYCPGTWCFIDMNTSETKHKVFNIIYATCLLVMIVCTVLCNVSVIYHLLLMFRRRKAHRSSIRRQQGHKRHRSIAKEVEHLVLLGFMTIAFVICSLPLVIHLYSGQKDKNGLIPLLFVSVNPIIDPWVFIILSPPVPRLLWDKICKTIKSKPTQEKVRSIHPVLFQKSPPGDSEGGSFLKVYTGIPGSAGS